MRRARLGAAGSAAGFVLVAVLGGLLVVGAVAFAMLFTASLDAMAVRARQTSVVAREALEAALALTAAELSLPSDPAGSESGPAGDHGPWPELGVPARVSVTTEPTEGGGLIVTLAASLPDEPGRAAQRLVLQLLPEPAVLRRW